MDTDFTKLLASALQRAADAHEAYQRENGADPLWPEWYADRMTRTLTEDRGRLQAVLLDALRAAGAAHGEYESVVLGGVHDVEWPAWYAEHMTGVLGDDAQALEPAIATFMARKDID